MRITNQMLGQNLTMGLTNVQDQLNSDQNKLSSGKRLSVPSDDPVGVESALRIDSTLSAVTSWKANAEQGLSFLQTTDSSLNNVMTMLQRTRELAVQAASDTYGADGRTNIAKEAQQILEQVGVVANTKYGSKYLFGGTNTNQPWDASTSTWNGNTSAIKYEIGSQSYVQINTNGQQLFQPTSGQGIFQTLSAFVSHLNNNQQTLINQDISALDTQLQNVIAVRADVGARSNRMETIQTQLDATNTQLTSNLSAIQDTDVSKVVIDLNNQENVYRAALSVGARIIQPSLIDFMR